MKRAQVSPRYSPYVSGIRKKVYLKMLILLAITTTTIVTWKGLTKGFVFSNIAVSTIVDSSGNIQINPFVDARHSMNQVGNLRSMRLVVILLPVFLHQITGIPLESLHFLPVTGLILPIVGYCLAKRLLNSEIYAFIYGLFLALETQNLSTSYNLNIQGYGFLFFLLIILFSLKSVRKTRSRKHYLLLLIFYIMTVLSYYGTEFYSLAYLLVLVVMSHLFHYSSTDIVESTKKFNLLLIVFILTVLVEPLVYSYSRIILYGYHYDILQTIVRYIGEAFEIIAGSERVHPVHINVGAHIFLLNIVLYVLVSIPIIFYIFKSFQRRFRNISFVFFSILVTGIIDAVLYIAWGEYLDNKYFLFLFPLLAFIGIKRARISNTAKRMHFKKVYLLVVIVILSLRFLLYTTGPWADYSLSRTQTRQVDFNWLSDHYKIEEKNIDPLIFLTDTDGAGQLLLAYASQGMYDNIIVYMHRSIDTSDFLYTGSSESLKSLKTEYYFGTSTVKFIIISTSNFNEGIPASDWSILPPLKKSSMFSACTVNVVYYGYEMILLKI